MTLLVIVKKYKAGHAFIAEFMLVSWTVNFCKVFLWFPAHAARHIFHVYDARMIVRYDIS